MNELQARIEKWNETRLDMFAISKPNDSGDFFGVIRFYYKDQGEKVATKCIRVASNASTFDVIETLREKLRSDMRMLSPPNYSLYVAFPNKDAIKLQQNEYPLIVQLNWIKDNLDGRFVVNNESDNYSIHKTVGEIYINEPGSKRKSTKKSKKSQKQDGIADVIFEEAKPSDFTRTISNPKFVVDKNRSKKRDKVAHEAKEIPIYTDISPGKYLVMTKAYPIDNVDEVVERALAKLNISDDPENYLIAKCVIPVNSVLDHCPPRERGTFMDYDEKPLDIMNKWDRSRGTMVFVMQPQPPGYKPKKARKRRPDDKNRPLKPHQMQGLQSPQVSVSNTITVLEGVKAGRHPKILEIISPGATAVVHEVLPNVTEVGYVPSTSKSFSQYIRLRQGLDIEQRHCVLANMEGIVTITPNDTDKGKTPVEVNGREIRETFMLENGVVIRLGRDTLLVFLDAHEDGQQSGISGQDLEQKIYSHFHREYGAIHAIQPVRVPRSGKSADQSIHALDHEPKPGPGYRHSDDSDDAGYVQPIADEPEYQQTPPMNYRTLLPAKIEYSMSTEDVLLDEILHAAQERPLQFRLSPSYTLYLITRHHLVAGFGSPLIEKITHKLKQYIMSNNSDPGFLAFWMANSSELLNFLRQDRELSQATEDYQEELAQTVQLAFKFLVHALEANLMDHMQAFFSTSTEDLPGEDGMDEIPMPRSQTSTMYDIIQMLNNAMSLLRRCRVNAALTIQLFSQLFHFINMSLFNEVIDEDNAQHYCNRSWGNVIRLRLARVEAWAEKQGLELAAECHLARVNQAMHLLVIPKENNHDVNEINSSCFKLNSVQLAGLLQSYRTEPGEQPIPHSLITNVVRLAETNADELAREDGRDVVLKEDPDLQLPFLLPEDGYTSDVLKGVPSGLFDFMEPLQAKGLCYFYANEDNTISWTIYFLDHEQDGYATQDHHNPHQGGSSIRGSSIRGSINHEPEPVYEDIILEKKGGGLGLSIVSAKGATQADYGIYIKSVVPGGAAYDDRRLCSGDLLVAVDDHSLEGLSQDRAADIMRHTGSTVKLTIIKDAASLYGVDQLLAQPSPSRTPADGAKLNGIRQSQSSYTTINNYYPDKPQIVSAGAPVKLTTELPLPPKHLLEATVNSDGHEYCLPPSKENTPKNRQQKLSDHERDQIVELKPKASPKSQKSDSQSENERSQKDRRSGRRHRDDRNRERKSSRHRERSQEKKKSETIGANKTGTLTSQSGTLGRKNKGGMWEDPQQRLIQEQLDMMRDEEIIELQGKNNKTATEMERLKVLMAQQEFSQRLKRDHIPSGTSEIDSYSEEDVPDRPDRDLLLKIQSQNSLNVHKSAEEETTTATMAEEISRSLELKEQELAEQRKREEKLAAQLEQQQRELERQQQLEREEEQRVRAVEEEKRQGEARLKSLRASEENKINEEERRIREEQEAEKAAFLAEKEAFEAERRKMEQERADFLRRQEEFRRMKEEQERFEREKAEFELEQQAQQRVLEQRSQQRELEKRSQQREQELQRKLREESRKKEASKKVDADKFDRELNKIRRRRASEEDKLHQRRKWIDEQDKLKEVEDSIERVVRDASPPRAHPYAAADAPLPPPPDSITNNYVRDRTTSSGTNRQLNVENGNFDSNSNSKFQRRYRPSIQQRLREQKAAEDRMEREREQLEELLTRNKAPVLPPQTRNASISSYTPLLPNHHFTKNKRPLSSYNPKTQESPQDQFTPLPQKSSVPTRPTSAYEPTSSPSPDLDVSAGVIGTNEIYNDPREKRLANIQRDNSFMRKSQPEPSKLNFRDRAKLFEQSGMSPQTNSKPKMSKKLLELEQQFGSR